MLLEKIDSPADLRRMSISQLPQLAREIRELIVSTVSSTGGHLAPNLGVVELTLALHYVFNTPADKIVWDVGHQCYTHKIVTGRRDSFATIRQDDGISGFCNRQESPYDTHTTGHSSNSVSLALGLAAARDLRGGDEQIVAVIGDGALTGGMALEALDHAGSLEHPLIVVLNDNEMSIDSNVGALSTHLSLLRSSPRYVSLKTHTKSVLAHIPLIGPPISSAVSAVKHRLKTGLVPGMFFEDLGFVYLGPVDGHDIPTLIELLYQAQSVGKPVLLHIHTQKGKGYYPAESDPTRWHGTNPFDIDSGDQQASSAPSYTSVFSSALIELADQDERIVGITAAMADGTGLKKFQDKYPQRFFDAAIAEQHAAGFAAGLAAGGQKPVFAVYSTFMQRACDQIIEDICMQPLPVVLAIDRAGLVTDGYSHQGMFDIAMLRALPNMTLMAPSSDSELKQMLRFALEQEQPMAIRYPRCAAYHSVATLPEIISGRGYIERQGHDICLFALGEMLNTARTVADRLEQHGISVQLVNARFASPIDSDLLCDCAASCGRLVTLEEGIRSGGFGEGCLDILSQAGIAVETMIAAIPDRFIEHGKRETLLKKCALDGQSVYEQIAERWFKKQSEAER